MMEEGLITAEEIEKIDQEVAVLVSESVRFAEESPDPDLESLLENVYA